MAFILQEVYLVVRNSKYLFPKKSEKGILILEIAHGRDMQKLKFVFSSCILFLSQLRHKILHVTKTYFFCDIEVKIAYVDCSPLDSKRYLKKI
jgi:hypothetical protein